MVSVRARWMLAVIIAAMACGVGTRVLAQDLNVGPPPAPETRQDVAVPALPDEIDSVPATDVAAELKSLRESVKRLEDEAQKRRDAEQAKKDSDALKAAEWIDMSTDKWNLKFGGDVQLDYINWANADVAISGPAAAPGTKDYFEFRRLRLVAEGTGYGVFDFRLQMTLETATFGDTPPAGMNYTPDVKDAYFSVNEIPWLGRFRIGNFFVPFSLEQVTNDRFNVFLERSIPVPGVFAADREVGIAFYNCTDDLNVTWAYGAFINNVSESAKKKIDDNQGYRLSGRVTWLPYYDEPSNGRYLVHLGSGILYTEDNGTGVRLRARPQIHEGPRLIDSGLLDGVSASSGGLEAHATATGNVELAVVWGPVTVQSEAFLSNVNLTTGSRNVGGAYAHLSYFLTGENRSYERFGQHGAQFTRTIPYSNFFWVAGGHSWGAWEAKARWSYLNLDSLNHVGTGASAGTKFGGQYNDLTVGMNWYWSDRTRVMFDWIHPVTNGQTTFGSTHSDLLAMRFDFNW